MSKANLTRRLRQALVALLSVGAAVGLVIVLTHLPAKATQRRAAVPAPGRPAVLSAPAVVEPASKLLELQSQVQGRLRHVSKESGQAIRRGELLAELENGVEQALVSLRKAELDQAQATLARLEAGARKEQLVQAKCEVERYDARLSLAKIHVDRMRALKKRGVRSAHTLDAALADQRMTRALRDQARARHQELKAGERPEVLAKARAEVAKAQAALRLAQAQLAHTRIVSPLDGILVYRHKEPGEVVGRQSDTIPVLSIASVLPLRLRADVDASDLARVRIGQTVSATTPAFPGRTYTGRVVKKEVVVGRKNIRTDRPREKIDTKVLEVVIELGRQRTSDLPLGLEMTVVFHPAPTR